jgi:DNA-binding PadR family transcriptional regulator
MSKYNKFVLKVLSDEKIKSTNQILKEVEELSGQVVNWHMLYRVLMELKEDGKVERLEAKAGFFWRKK